MKIPNPFSNKQFELGIGDIVSIAKGRGWRRAKIQKNLGNGIFLVKYRDGTEEEVREDNIMTEQEAKKFSKVGGTTRVLRKSNDGDSAEESANLIDEDSEEGNVL